MKTYYAECVVKYTYIEQGEEPYSDEEIYEYVFNETSLKKAKEKAKQRAIEEFNTEYGTEFENVKVTVEDVYETLSDARL